MSLFIVNPPIQHDEDYYRDDTDLVAAILAGQSVLVIGLRRSGKTSFLMRVQRAALAAGRACHFEELAGDDADAPAKVAAIREALARDPRAMIVLDEAEAWRRWPEPTLRELLALTRRTTVVISCAPQFVLELGEEPEVVHQRVDGLHRHALGPLRHDEAEGLLRRRQRGESPFDDATVERLLARGERMPIVLQALGAEEAAGTELATSLAGFGNRILSGLGNAARDLLVAAAHGGTLDVARADVSLLVSIGALRKEAGSACIASRLLSTLVCAVSTPPNAGSGARAGDRPDAASPRCEWSLHMRILHMSDLHFGHTIDPADVQAERLIAALERDQRIPHVVAITGDLTWTGSPSELRLCEPFVERLARWLGECWNLDDRESRRRVIIVPGNHEASWNLSAWAPSGQVPIADEHWLTYALAPFANFAHRFYRGGVIWDLDAPCVAFTFADPAVTFVAASSAHFITRSRSIGKFGPTVRDRMVQLLDGTDASRFRIALWHHNLILFQEDAPPIVDIYRAADALVRIKPGVDLVLHGHVHQGDVDKFLPRDDLSPLLFSAVGSFGVVADHRPGDDQRGRTPNEFALVELETAGPLRRSVTTFYTLDQDAMGHWAWHARRAKPPRPL